ncbi:archaetidylserine decarboxylase [Robbsia sp. KACC 23696]|uniref:archaetidylserine decarboxylase n=1 Tax=Robbsia sp. KACC 23696 TaxID=3149231 RepID=UPI00325AB6ED
MSDRIALLFQHLLPKGALTSFAGRVASARAGALTTGLIRLFVDKYHVDMTEAANSNIDSYASFNDFFTRALKPGARPIADAAFVSPVDGAISQLGAIDEQKIVQAKGHDYTVSELLGGDAALAQRFQNGRFANLYLSPRDYHRLHMPCDGRLTRMVHVPGSLYSVNPTTARGVPKLFARNERVVCEFESDTAGTFVMVLVGATIVGSIATVWHGVVNAQRPQTIREWKYDDQDIVLKQGAEMGRFLLGSTVIMLFQSGSIALNPAWTSERAVRLGEVMGTRGA